MVVDWLVVGLDGHVKGVGVVGSWFGWIESGLGVFFLRQQREDPSCLWYIGDFTTQLNGDYNAPQKTIEN